MAVIEIVENGRGHTSHIGSFDTESIESKALAADMMRRFKYDHYIVRAIDERGGSRPVGTIDDVKETDRSLQFDRPPML